MPEPVLSKLQMDTRACRDSERRAVNFRMGSKSGKVAQRGTDMEAWRENGTEKAISVVPGL
jgi:hypothetical protein